MSKLTDELAHRIPARYWPFAAGRYEVKAGLHRFGTDFGNGEADRQIFQVDCQFQSYRRQKLRSRADGLEQCVLSQGWDETTGQAVIRLITHRLAAEHPSWFRLQATGDGWRLDCVLTSDSLRFDHDWRLDPDRSRIRARPRYVGSLDALACQIQEDLAVTRAQDDRNWLAALHVCMPSHWSAQSKIGRDFAEVHAPVPGMEPINRRAKQYVQQMTGAKEGLVRFVWGVQADGRLSHPDPGSVAVEDLKPDRAFVRIERQTIWGLPRMGASLFTIRPYLVRVERIRRDPVLRGALVNAVESMPRAALAYKGLLSWRDELLVWMRPTR